MSQRNPAGLSQRQAGGMSQRQAGGHESEAGRRALIPAAGGLGLAVDGGGVISCERWAG